MFVFQINVNYEKNVYTTENGDFQRRTDYYRVRE